MRKLFIFRGVPASGKSTFVEKYNLQAYTICADNIRLLYTAPSYDLAAKQIISSKADKKVWQFIFQLLEYKMKVGETIFLDATHCNNKSLKPYKELIEKYHYRAYIADFMKDDNNDVIDKSVFLERNKNRESLKRVPDEVIDRMYDSYIHAEKPSSQFKIISPNDIHKELYDTLYDFNEWKEIVIFGDIHGCVEPLQEYFEANPFDSEKMYIFVGDYIDRGLQNSEVILYLNHLLIKSGKTHNVLLLEGNHERNLRNYLENGQGDNKEFNEKTLPQIETMDKSLIKNIINRLGQMAYFMYNGKNYFVSHGGMPIIPNNLVTTQDLIKGTGEYGDISKVYDTWLNLYSENMVLVHGHRNIQMLPTKVKDNIYNLNDEIEFGGNLRILIINEDGEQTLEIKNNTCGERPSMTSTRSAYTSDNEFIKALNESSLVNKRILRDGIVSYNFNRDAFNDKKWNDLTVKARGLFIDSQTDKVVARGYQKFFNLNELPETQLSILKNTLQFPVTAYKKENGFLGLVSYDKRNDKLFIASKSTNEGPFAGYLREQWELLPKSTQSLLTQYLKENDVTLVFEVINQDTDPHIIRYSENGLYLLDIIVNDFDFTKMAYEELVKFADKYDLKVKKRSYIIKDYESLKCLIDQTEKMGNEWNAFEGWVFEDAKGYMFKYKTPFYKFWKQMRSLKDRLASEKEVRDQELWSDKARDVVEFMRQFKTEALAQKSIIDIREMYEAANDEN